MDIKKAFLTVLMACVVIFMSGPALAVPGIISYQGKATDDLGASLDGTYTMRFYLFDNLTGGSLLWQEEQTVIVVNGVYNVQLGSMNTMDSSVFAGDEAYLGVSIYNDTTTNWETLSPRLRITCVGYAFQAENAQTLAGYESSYFAPASHEHSGYDISSGIVDKTYIDPEIARDSEITWSRLSGIPPDIADGDQVGITTETDPTVPGSIKDGISWDEISSKPPGFADGVDNTGITTETDPQVGNNVENYVAVWNGSSLSSGTYSSSIYNELVNLGGIPPTFEWRVGIGTSNPESILHISAGQSGDAVLILEADPDNNNEADQPAIQFWQDGRAVRSIIGFDGAKNALQIMTSNDDGDTYISFSTGTMSATSEKMTIAFNGNVGIGTVGPQEKLHVREKSNDYGAAILLDSTGGTDGRKFWVGSTLSGNAGGAGLFQIYDATAYQSRLNIDSAGNVGVGTTNPGAKLEVSSGSLDAIYGHGYGTGVKGVTFTTYSDEYGVYGKRDSNGYFGYLGGDYGVYGQAWSDGTGVYGYGETGVYGHGSSYGIFGYASDGIGVFGNGTDYDFYAGGQGSTNYGPFTGGHEVRFAADMPANIIPGMIVSVTGRTEVRETANGDISLSSTLPTVRLACKFADNMILGVIVKETPLPKDHWYTPEQGERFGIVNALGEGRVWVTNVNGNIKPGDYITSSDIPGYGQRQDDDLLHSYTLGRAIEKANWQEVTETLEYKGRTFKIFLIAVVYTSG